MKVLWMLLLLFPFIALAEDGLPTTPPIDPFEEMHRKAEEIHLKAFDSFEYDLKRLNLHKKYVDYDSLWTLQYIVNSTNPSYFQRFPFLEYLKQLELEHPYGFSETRCLYFYCRMGDKDGCKSLCELYMTLQVREDSSTTYEKDGTIRLDYSYANDQAITDKNCPAKCTSHCETPTSCREECDKLCAIRYSYPDTAEYDKEVDKFRVAAIRLRETAQQKLKTRLKAFYLQQNDFSKYKYNATKMHWDNFFSNAVPNIDQRHCYYIYCRWEDKDGCRKQCANYAKHYRAGPTRNSTAMKSIPDCVESCKYDCVGADCEVTCGKLCQISFTYDNPAKYEEETELHIHDFNEIMKKFQEVLAAELPMFPTPKVL